MNSWDPNEFLTNLDPASLAISGCTIVVLGLAVSTAVQWYRLSHIRGPWLASLTSLWIYRSIKGMDLERVAHDTQRKYGKIIRIAPSAVLLSDPEMVWRINSARSSYTRGGWYGSIRFNPYGDSVFSEMDTARHDRQKAKLASGFSGRGVANLERSVDTQLAILVGVLKKATDQDRGRAVVDIGRVLQHFQLDLITFAGMGKAWGDLPQNEDHFQYLATVNKLFPSVQLISVVPWLRSVFFSKPFLRCFGPSMTDGWLGALREAVERRVSGGDAKDRTGDLLDEWFRHGISPAEAELELSIQVPAGSDTSISVIRATLLHLMTSPAIYQKLKNEIAAGIQDCRISSPIKNQEAKSLPYLQAVVNEGIRTSPPLTIGFPKEVPLGGDVICGKAVPAGTEVYVNLVSLLRDQDVFGHDADTFRPERFLDCDDDTKARRMKVVDLVFGYGRWQCLGKTLAWMEMNKIFVELLRSFDFQIPNPEKVWSRKTTLSWFITDFFALVTDGSIE